MEWSTWGGEFTWVNGPPLFLLKLDGVSRTAGQGRGAEGGCWWMDLLFIYFLCDFMHVRTHDWGGFF